MARKPNEPLPKSEWGPGPWQDEPDRLDWTDEATGLPCRIIRAEVTGALCGYVGVRDGHPWYGLPYNELVIQPRDFAQRKFDDRVGAIDVLINSFRDDKDDGRISISMALEVHGGCTFAEFWEEPDLWWFGFDTAHAGDLCPAMNALMRLISRERPDLGLPMRELRDYETYRTLDYVRVECAGLARQLFNLLPQETVHDSQDRSGDQAA